MNELEKNLKELDKKIIEENKNEKNFIPVCRKCGR